jgi:hypothetical protein
MVEPSSIATMMMALVVRRQRATGGVGMLQRNAWHREEVMMVHRLAVLVEVRVASTSMHRAAPTSGASCSVQQPPSSTPAVYTPTAGCAKCSKAECTLLKVSVVVMVLREAQRKQVPEPTAWPDSFPKPR